MPATRHSYAAIIKRFFRWCWKAGTIRTAPEDLWPLDSYTYRQRKVLADPVTLVRLKACANAAQLLILYLGAHAGTREIMRARVSDFDPHARCISIRSLKGAPVWRVPAEPEPAGFLTRLTLDQRAETPTGPVQTGHHDGHQQHARSPTTTPQKRNRPAQAGRYAPLFPISRLDTSRKKGQPTMSSTKRGARWVLDWRDKQGRRRRFFKSRKQAERSEAEIKRWKRGEGPKPKLATLAIRWLALKAHLRPNTHYGYQLVLRKLATLTPPNLPAQKTTAQHLQPYREYLGTLEAGTRKHHCSILDFKVRS